MVRAVRSGSSKRSIAQRFKVSVSTVSFWVERSKGQRLNRCDFEDRPSGPRRPWNRTLAWKERQILTIRHQLRHNSTLGEFGAPAIRAQMLTTQDAGAPAVATIGRILKRHGQMDYRTRVRRPPPPRGWYLPAVARAEAELDSFDVIEDLKIKDGPLFSVLTATSLHGRKADAWPKRGIGAEDAVTRLTRRWKKLGLPACAQFDNDTRFQGAHQFPDTVGRVSRLCLALGVMPVFAVPLEHGFQNAIEGFNGLWEAKVWRRFEFPDLPSLQRQSRRYIRAYLERTAQHAEAAPPRRAFPEDWRFDLDQPLRGTLIYLRRTDSDGRVHLLGHCFTVDRLWTHRLVRCEVQLDLDRILCYALRRRDPENQPLLATIPYPYPNKPFRGKK